jgi:hypothetical protein
MALMCVADVFRQKEEELENLFSVSLYQLPLQLPHCSEEVSNYYVETSFSGIF